MMMRVLVLFSAGLLLGGCGVVAAPCRVTTAGLDIVPVVGHVAATPTKACGQAIDPGG